MNAEPTLYDFRSPNRFSREQLRALHMVNETFARQMATVLSTTLRIVAHTDLEEVGQSTYDEYIARVPSPSLLVVLTFQPMRGVGLFQLPMSVVMDVIDRLLGGPGGENQPQRALSDIEASLIRNLLQRMVAELGGAFEILAPVTVEVTSLESDPQFLQLVPPSDTVIVADYEIRLGDLEAKSSLAIPLTTIQPMVESLNAKKQRELTSAESEAALHLNQRMNEVPVAVAVSFRPITLSSQDIMALEVGDVLPLRHPTNQPLTVSADGVPVATAVPGSHGSRLACQIVER